MARALDEAARLVGDRVVVGIFERPERLVRHIGAVGVGVELGPGRPVLQIIFAVVLGDPGAFDIGLGRLAVGEQAVVVLPEALPAMLVGVRG